MNKVFSQARQNKDPNFNGLFVFAVKTTGIFCRPSCPSPTAKESNVLYFKTILEALNAGFRPCLRCRPDTQIYRYNANIHCEFLVESALQLIYEGYLNQHSVQALAAQLQISDRHLRQLFVKQLGMPPSKVAQYHRALFAKKLLLNYRGSITDIAYMAGFRSIRQFNAVFQQTFALSPSQLRQQHGSLEDAAVNTLSLPYQSPFDFQQVLGFMGERGLQGVEHIDASSYSRSFVVQEMQGYFHVSDDPANSCLRLQIHCDDIRCYMPLFYRVRRMFDLDTQFTAINEQFAADPYLQGGMPDGHVPRLPVAFDSFEFVIRAILGQQVSVATATTLAGRVAQRFGTPTAQNYPVGLSYYFPSLSQLLGQDLSNLGIQQRRQETIQAVLQALDEQRLSLDSNQSFAQFKQDFLAIKGIGEWTVHYVAMRGLGMMDAFPASDLGVLKALSQNGNKPSIKTVKQLAEAWRPYRSYAMLCLWRSLEQEE